MLRKHLAILLVLSWIALSGFDVIEDLDFPDQTELHNGQEPLPTGSGELGRLANNIIESADHSSRRHSSLLEQPVVEGSVGISAARRKTSKLHKLHSVFLI